MQGFAVKSDGLEKYGIKHGFFTRNMGVSQGVYSSLNCGFGSNDSPDVVRNNRTIVAEYLGIDKKNLLTLYQYHSAEAIVVNSPWNENTPPKADAMVTNKSGIALGILTADCLPILFADVDNKVIAAAHSGWRGSVNGIIDNTITRMVELGAKRANILAIIGPGISIANYEVDATFHSNLLKLDYGNIDFFKNGRDTEHFMFDLKLYAKERILANKVKKVDILEYCTYSDEKNFFSYRRATHNNENDYGRQISVILLS